MMPNTNEAQESNDGHHTTYLVFSVQRDNTGFVYEVLLLLVVGGS
jgi:hypothetical protein